MGNMMTDGVMRSRHNKNINKRKQSLVHLPTVTQLRALWKTNRMPEDKPPAERQVEGELDVGSRAEDVRRVPLQPPPLLGLLRLEAGR
jgi:hypothetical protein